MRLPGILRVLAVLAATPCLAAAQTPADSAVSATQQFEYTASVLVYFLPDDDDYAGPIFSADRGRLHLEARYNYEDLRTASLWAGATWAGGSRFLWDVTPMAGLVFGRTDGLAPGLEMTLGYWKLEWYSESEFVIGFNSREEDFFYTWSNFSLNLLENAQISIAVQRTLAFESDVDIGRGPFIGGTFRNFSCTFYSYNRHRDDRYFILEADVAW